MPKLETWTGTKKDFITSMGPSALPNEIIEAAKERGLKLTLNHVYAVRTLVKREAKERAKASTSHVQKRKKRAKVARKASPKPAGRSPRMRRARPARPASSAAPRSPSSRTSSVDRRGSSSRTEAWTARRGDGSPADLLASFDEEKLENLIKAAAAMLGIPRALRVLEDGRNIAVYTLLKALPQ